MISRAVSASVLSGDVASRRCLGRNLTVAAPQQRRPRFCAANRTTQHRNVQHRTVTAPSASQPANLISFALPLLLSLSPLPWGDTHWTAHHSAAQCKRKCNWWTRQYHHPLEDKGMRSLAARLGPSGRSPRAPAPGRLHIRPDFDPSACPVSLSVSGRTGDTPANAATRLGQHLSALDVGGRSPLTVLRRSLPRIPSCSSIHPSFCPVLSSPLLSPPLFSILSTPVASTTEACSETAFLNHSRSIPPESILFGCLPPHCTAIPREPLGRHSFTAEPAFCLPFPKIPSIHSAPCHAMPVFISKYKH